MLAVPLIALGAVLPLASYLEWTRNQRALRRGEPLPRSPLPRILAAFVTAVPVAAAALALLGRVLWILYPYPLMISWVVRRGASAPPARSRLPV